MATPSRLLQMRYGSHPADYSGAPKHEQKPRLSGSLDSFRKMAQGIIRANPVPVAFVPFQNEDYMIMELHEKFSSLLDQAISSTSLKEYERLKTVRSILQELDANDVNVRAFLSERNDRGETYLIKAVKMRFRPKLPGPRSENAPPRGSEIPEDMRIIPPTMAMVATILDYGGKAGYMEAIAYLRSHVEKNGTSVPRFVFAPEVYAYLCKLFL